MITSNKTITHFSSLKKNTCRHFLFPDAKHSRTASRRTIMLLKKHLKYSNKDIDQQFRKLKPYNSTMEWWKFKHSAIYRNSTRNLRTAVPSTSAVIRCRGFDEALLQNIASAVFSVIRREDYERWEGFRSRGSGSGVWSVGRLACWVIVIKPECSERIGDEVIQKEVCSSRLSTVSVVKCRH